MSAQHPYNVTVTDANGLTATQPVIANLSPAQTGNSVPVVVVNGCITTRTYTYNVTVTDANGLTDTDPITTVITENTCIASGPAALNGFTSFFANEGECCGLPAGMNETLRVMRDHIGLSFSSNGPLPPIAAGSSGLGQINSLTGAYAVYNDNTWKVYPAKLGLIAINTADGKAWVNTGSTWVVQT